MPAVRPSITGKCRSCKTREPLSHKSICERCCKMKKDRRAEKAKLGICQRCDNKADHGYKTCEACREREKACRHARMIAKQNGHSGDQGEHHITFHMTRQANRNAGEIVCIFCMQPTRWHKKCRRCEGLIHSQGVKLTPTDIDDEQVLTLDGKVCLWCEMHPITETIWDILRKAK